MLCLSRPEACGNLQKQRAVHLSVFSISKAGLPPFLSKICNKTYMAVDHDRLFKELITPFFDMLQFRFLTVELRKQN